MQGGPVRWAALFVAAVLVMAANLLPGVGRSTHRVTVDPASLPWSAVARLQVPGVSRCTAVLISPRVAVTAAHCLYGRRLGHFVPPESVHVLLGYSAGAFTNHAVAARYQIAAGFDPQATTGAAYSDLALVRFDEDLASSARVVPVSEGDATPGLRLLMGGYGQDRAEVVLADPDCSARGFVLGRDNRPVLLHDCAATRGASGGPVFARGADGSWRLMGVQVGAYVDSVGGAAVPASAIRALIAR